MKKAGCLIVIIGVAIFVGSFFLFGKAVWEGIQAQMVASAPVKLEKTASTEVVTVDAAKACQVALHIDLETLSVEEEEDSFETGKMNYQARYAFPVTYTVKDEQGGEVFKEETAAAWDQGTKSWDKEEVTKGKGAVIVEHSFSKFDVPPPGKVKVEIKVSPDEKYKAVAGKMEVRLYDNVARHAKTVAGGIASFLLGPTVAGLGILVFIFGLVFDKKNP
jgi:hypothetical protein